VPRQQGMQPYLILPREQSSRSFFFHAHPFCMSLVLAGVCGGARRSPQRRPDYLDDIARGCHGYRAPTAKGDCVGNRHLLVAPSIVWPTATGSRFRGGGDAHSRLTRDGSAWVVNGNGNIFHSNADLVSLGAGSRWCQEDIWSWREWRWSGSSRRPTVSPENDYDILARRFLARHKNGNRNGKESMAARFASRLDPNGNPWVVNLLRQHLPAA